jgi:DNA polymerase III gamma/tau subunit
MYIPDVINTILMGLIFMIIVVTVVRPLMLKLVGQYVDSDHLQKAMLEAIQKELTRASEEAEAKRAERIKYQMLLLETPEKPKLKPVVVPEPEPEPEPTPEPVAEEVPVEAPVEEAPAEETAVAEETTEDTDAASADNAAEAAPEGETQASEGAAEPQEEESEVAEGEIEIREGETLAEIKERMKREQKQKKPTIPPELLNNANSYEDKVGVVRMVVQTDHSRVAAVIRSMIEVKK